MLQTAILVSKYYENQEVRLTDITTLKVYNAGTTIAFINGIPIYPNQKEVIIVPDGTFSNVILEIKFLETENLKAIINQILFTYKKLI